METKHKQFFSWGKFSHCSYQKKKPNLVRTVLEPFLRKMCKSRYIVLREKKRSEVTVFMVHSHLMLSQC